MKRLTDPTGVCFVSYRRTRKDEIRIVVEALHDLGIPTWQDLEDLEEEHTNSAIRKVLGDPNTACALVWITPDVVDSPTMGLLEFPLINRRAERKDGFFFVPVVAGGLSRGEVPKTLRDEADPHDLSEWNLRKVTADPADPALASQVAKWVLARRLKALAKMAPGEPLSLWLSVRSPPPQGPGHALILDWTHRFRGRHALPGGSSDHLLPALSHLADAVGKYVPGYRIVASGTPTLSAAVALGHAFMAPRGIRIGWRQSTVGRTVDFAGTERPPPASWSLDVPSLDSGFQIKPVDKDIHGSELAVQVSVVQDVEPAVAATMGDLPPIRALLEGELPTLGNIQAGEAVDIAHKVAEAIRRARKEFPRMRQVHLFMAVPAGLAMLIGQLLNTLGPIQLYEHEATDSVGKYVPSFRLA